MWWRRSWFSLKGKADIPGQTEGRPATSIGPRVPPVGSLQQRAAGRSSHTRSYADRDLIMSQEVMQEMRADDQIVFVRGQRPVRRGRVIFFCRKDMKALVGVSRFHTKSR